MLKDSALAKACYGSKLGLLMAAVRRYADDRDAAPTERVASCADPHKAMRATLAGIAKRLVMGVPTLRKTGVPPAQPTPLLTQADQIVPSPTPPKVKHP